MTHEQLSPAQSVLDTEALSLVVEGVAQTDYEWLCWFTMNADAMSRVNPPLEIWAAAVRAGEIVIPEA